MSHFGSWVNQILSYKKPKIKNTLSKSTVLIITTPEQEKSNPGGTSNIAMWMLDTDYDGRSVYPQQVFLSNGW